MTGNANSFSIAIPTYRRELVLIDSIRYLLALEPKPIEILVVDQTEKHEEQVEQQLNDWVELGEIRWIRLSEPSIPKAMNRALIEAIGDFVLFLDDDIVPDTRLLAAHFAAHQNHSDAIIAGRVLQPWHRGTVSFDQSAPFHFAHEISQQVREFMGGNFSVPRIHALQIGGFDENFVKVAYRFEAEFAHRWLASDRKIWFCADAVIEHLKAGGGGTRAHGLLLQTLSPSHSVGTYYYALRTMSNLQVARTFFWQPFRAVITRHHLRKPWWIIPSFIAELRGVALALKLQRDGPKLLRMRSST
jgi:glycosyltransferase involved in cell wall biosynthesis